MFQESVDNKTCITQLCMVQLMLWLYQKTVINISVKYQYVIKSTALNT